MTAATPRVANNWGVIGHVDAVDGLKRAVERSRLRHAMVFAGPESVGKRAVARAFAQAVCCIEPPSPGVSCGVCLACRKIARGVHPDVQTFSLETQALADTGTGKNTTLTIDTIRRISSSTVLRPMEARWRIILIDDAEKMQGPAQEALLKTLEEPPSFVLIILLANDTEALLPTIRSRCQVIELQPVTTAQIEAGLLSRGVGDARGADLAALAAGRPGWAIAAAANPKLIERRRDSVDRSLRWVVGSGYDRLVTAVRLGDSFTKKRDEHFTDLVILLDVWRDVMLVAAGLEPALLPHTHPGNSVFPGQDLPLADAHRGVRSVFQCIADLEANVRPRLALETMVLQWPTIKNG